MAFCTNCGKQLDEGAKFCSTCGAAVPQTTWEENSERKTVYDGELHKCPNCGEQINSFVAVCPACGYEFRGAKTASCVKELAAKLEPVSDPEQRDDLIRNFYIPNTKEDICEFFILAVSNIKARDDCEDAWRAKLEQAYQKARLSFGNDSSFSEINKLYESVTKREPLNQFIVNRMAADYGDIPLAAAGIIKRVYQFPYSAAIGIGQGMLPLVAYNYASGNYSRMRQTIRCAMIFSMAFASVLITVYELLPSQIIRLFINERTTIVLAADFLRIVCTAMPFVIFNFQICYVFQAMGMGKEALIISACRQGIIYIPMILLMNAVFKMYGVIWAQTITDMLALLISVVLYMKTNRNLRMQESSKIG